MENIRVKFGTPTPIKFREYDKDHPQIDLDLEVRFAGLSVVSAYDAALYDGDDEVSLKVRETALQYLTERIRTWPEGRSFWKNTTKTVLEESLDRRLSEYGITAKTDIFSFALTPESRELYDAAIKDVTEQKMYIDILDRYGNISYKNEGQPVFGKSPFTVLLTGNRNPFTPSSDDKAANTDETTVMGIVPNGSRINTSKDKFCRFCGTKRVDGAVFCTECGTKFS